MALDVVILDHKGAPEGQVSISVDVHWEIIKGAQAQGSPLLLRISDYYDDAHYSWEELGELQRDVAALTDRFVDSEEVKSTLNALIILIQRAKAEGKPVVAIAD